MISNTTHLACSSHSSCKPMLESSNPDKKSSIQAKYNYFTGQLKSGGLVGDLIKAGKLANFWVENAIGHTTEVSQKITKSAQDMNRYLGFLALPDRAQTLANVTSDLQKGTARSVADFVEGFTGFGKSVLDGRDLLGKSFGVLSKETLTALKPMEHFAPASALAMGSKEIIFKNVPDIRENVGTRNADAAHSMIKLAKHTSLVGVGVLGLSEAFFMPLASAATIPSLLTVTVVSSLSARFFEGLVLTPKARPI